MILGKWLGLTLTLKWDSELWICSLIVNQSEIKPPTLTQEFCNVLAIDTGGGFYESIGVQICPFRLITKQSSTASLLYSLNILVI